MYQLIAMEHLIPPGQKKVPKVYTAACHPLLPHLVAVAANSGTPSGVCFGHSSEARVQSVICSMRDMMLKFVKCLTRGYMVHAGVAFLSFDVYDTPPVHCLPLGREEGGDLFDDEGNPAKGDGTLDELEAVLAPEAAAASAASLAEAKANGLVPGDQPQKGVTLLGGLVDRKSKVMVRTGREHMCPCVCETCAGNLQWAISKRVNQISSSGCKAPTFAWALTRAWSNWGCSNSEVSKSVMCRDKHSSSWSARRCGLCFTAHHPGRATAGRAARAS